MNKPIPDKYNRVILVNPTKYLGNLLIAGGLMQAFSDYCGQHEIQLRIVIDESFRELCGESFPQENLVYFPRRQISQAGFFKKLSLYRNCLKQLRSFAADVAFNIEEDSATSHLTRLSGASYKMGCSPARHSSGYNHVVPVQFESENPARMHRWYSFYEMFAVLGMGEPEKSYIDITLKKFPQQLANKLKQCGWNQDLKTIAVHAGATKKYKQWPLEHVTALLENMTAAGMQPVLLGTGKSDAAINNTIIQLLKSSSPQQLPVNLCNQLSLLELAQFLQQCAAMIGTDSGPFHLGSCLGIPGLVLWGPTNKAIWGPLGKQSEIIQGDFPCDPGCNKGHCLHEHRCMKELSPDKVFEGLSAILL